jgi:hypothetical protein
MVCSCQFNAEFLQSLPLYSLWRFTQPHTGAAAVFVDEFDTGHFQGSPILAADKWISDLQFFDYLSLLQVFRIENGTSCAHGCRDDQSIID